MNKDPFKEYLKESEPDKAGKGYAWSTYISIHRELFRGIYRHAGKIREYNITKKEWVLDGETVIYGSAKRHL